MFRLSSRKPLSHQLVSTTLTLALVLLPLAFAGRTTGAASKPLRLPESSPLQKLAPDAVPPIPAGSAYRQTNFISDIPGFGFVQDPLLINPWGIAFRGTSPFWVSNNGTSSARLFRGDVAGSPLVKNPGLSLVTVPGGLPTGVVGNATTDFAVTPCAVASCPAAFIFSSITGNIVGWNPSAGPNSTTGVIAASHAGHVYTGLAIGSNSGGNRLYAADFNNGNIDVYDGTYALTTTTGSFADPTIPTTAGNTYHPFNIQNIGGSLYVMYAKVGSDGKDEEGVGNGFVRRFNTDGVRDLTFGINNGPLNSPWGVAIAPSTFGIFGSALLIGNFGEGNPSLHAFNPTTGAFLGTIQNENGDGVVIDELWGLQFGNGVNGGDVGTLYFTAGTAEEEHGLFGSLKPTTETATSLIQFATDDFAISEGSGHIDISVTRAGDVSGPATVNFNTFDESQAGHASQKSDYEIALGKLTFNPGETSKTFRILLVDDSFAEGDEVIDLALSNPTGAGVGLSTPNSAEVRIIDDDGDFTAVPRTATGANPAAIQAAVDAFRADLGGVNNGVGGSFATGRREINWDGVPDGSSAPNAFPADFFNVNSPRGAVFSTAGTGFQVSANATNPTSTPVRFGNLNATYPATFQTFSPQRLFTALGSKVSDTSFFIPGTTTPATVSGFGAVFTDVDNVDTTKIQYFDQDGGMITEQIVPATNNGLSFVGLSFTDRRVGKVRIISGNVAPGPTDSPPGTDVVVMDDFIYGEPQAVVPTINPIDVSGFFVRQHYLDFLNREPDASGFAFWVDQIESCGTDAACREIRRINVSAAFFLSIEFQKTGLEAYLTHRAAFGPTVPSGGPAPVLYGTFERDTQALGKDYIVGAPGADQQLEANKVAYFNDFVTRPEFVDKYPSTLTNAQYVDNLLASAGLSPSNFVVKLTNGQENPPANPTLTGGARRPASFGTATFNMNTAQTQMTFTATINNIDFTGSQSADTNDDLTAAHIHAGPSVAPGVNGPVVWGFFGAPLNDNNPNDVVNTPLTGVGNVGGTISGKWDPPEGNGTTFAAQLSNLKSGHAYINFHTTQFGGGEIRGNFPEMQGFRDSLVTGLDAMTDTRAGVLRKVAEYAFLKDREFNNAFVFMEYAGYLRRDPDTSGFNFWLRKLNEFNGNFVNAEMVKAFISSGEYRQRFGP